MGLIDFDGVHGIHRKVTQRWKTVKTDERWE